MMARRPWLLWSVALYLLLAANTAFGGEIRHGALRLKFTGNQVLVDEVYLAVLELPENARPTAKLARRVERRLERFLRESGYELAMVTVKVTQNGLSIDINEGRIEKVLFVGKGTVRTLQLKLDLSLPFRVFNRPFLERQLDVFSEKYSIANIRYGLVETRKVDGTESTIDWGRWTGDVALFPESARYDLVIYLGESNWGSGVGVGLNYRSSDGALMNLRYRDTGLVFSDDRWEIRGELGGKLRTRLDSSDAYVALTVGDLGWKWYAPGLWGSGFRPSFELANSITSRQRADLRLESYYSERVQAAAALQFEWADRMGVSVGGGMQGRWIFRLDQLSDATVAVEGGFDWRPFVEGRLDMVFNAGHLRRDRLHRLELGARRFWWTNGNSTDCFDGKYQGVIPIGWHELRFTTRGAIKLGSVAFDDDLTVHGDHVRGVFGDQFFVHRVASLSLEFRWSITRDVLMIGLFHDLAVFGQEAWLKSSGSVRVANSFGPGLYVLLIDTFQLDIQYGVGFASDGGFDHGLVLNIQKVF